MRARQQSEDSFSTAVDRIEMEARRKSRATRCRGSKKNAKHRTLRIYLRVRGKKEEKEKKTVDPPGGILGCG